jgi:hypothetical protein
MIANRILVLSTHIYEKEADAPIYLAATPGISNIFGPSSVLLYDHAIELS